MTTVVCLDDYHSLDRQGRKRESVTALDPKAQNFDLMYEQIKDMKDGKTVAKPIYNHVSGALDAPEDTKAAKVSDRAIGVGLFICIVNNPYAKHATKHTCTWTGISVPIITIQQASFWFAHCTVLLTSVWLGQYA